MPNTISPLTASILFALMVLVAVALMVTGGFGFEPAVGADTIQITTLDHTVTD